MSGGNLKILKRRWMGGSYEVSQFSVKLGTFNAYNLVLPGVVYYSNRQYSQEAYEKKVAWIAEQLRRMDAGIVGFQEVFHEEALREAVTLSGIYEDSEVIMGEEQVGSPGPLNGLVSMYPVADQGSISLFPDSARLEYDGAVVPIKRFTKPVIWASLKIWDDVVATVFVVHLKSKRPLYTEGSDLNDPKVRAGGKAKALILRAAESLALRCIIVDKIRDTTTPVILLGDVNDAVHAVTSDIIAGSPPWRYLPHGVKDIQARRSRRDVYYTHIFNGNYESLDHVFVSEEFVLPNPEHIGYVENVRVLNDHLIDETLASEEIPNWQSDHGQVVATIRMR
jgi:endonuclease/exonuclease/phosphatase family metal-dependent hydrolase